MNWYAQPCGDRWIIRATGAWGGMAVLPCIYRDELCARVRAAEINNASALKLYPLASFDTETQRERDLFDWAVERYGWREEGEFEDEGFRDREQYESDLRAVQIALAHVGGALYPESVERRDRMLEEFAEWVERRVRT